MADASKTLELVEKLNDVLGADLDVRRSLVQMEEAIGMVGFAEEFVKSGALNKLKTHVSELMAVQYTEEELQGLIDFWSSDLGKKWQLKHGEVSRLAMTYGAELGRKVAAGEAIE